MQEAINKAAALVEAHAYIRSFAGRVVVVKVGGSIMDTPEALGALLQDACFMRSVGMRPILVHGGGKGITAAMQQAGLEAQFVQGRRYTDDRTLAIAEHVLVNDINAGMVQTIRDANHEAMGLHSLSSCVVFGKRLFLEGEAGRKIDIGIDNPVGSFIIASAMNSQPYRPISLACSTMGYGNSSFSSHSSPAGRITSSANPWTHF